MEHFYSFLTLNGVDAFLFQVEDPHKSLKDVMSSEVKRRDKLVFIASKNSLQSEGCQYELSVCRQEYKYNCSIRPIGCVLIKADSLVTTLVIL